MTKLWTYKAGFTLIELMMSTGLISLLLVIGLPNLNQLVLSIAHRAYALDIESFINQQRQAAIHSNQHVFVTIDPEQNCIGASVSNICNCGKKNACSINGKPAVIALDKGTLSIQNLRLAKKNHIRFEKRLGVAVGHNGSFRISSAHTQTAYIISALGRSRLCVSKGNIPGLSQC